MLKFLVISDLHLVPDGKHSHGLDTAQRFDQAIEHVIEHHSDAAFCILAGDLADHGEKAAYEQLQSRLPRFPIPVHMTLGNHDNLTVFKELFPDAINSETGAADFVIDEGGHRIIVLDSYEGGDSAAGSFTEIQIAWLKARLTEAQHVPIIVVLHHNITEFHVQTDFIRLRHSDQLLETLKGHRDIRQIISGHVHMTTSGSIDGMPFCTLAGNHYSIAPELISRTGPVPNLAARLEGPGQYAVVLAGERSTVVHFENFLDRHIQLAKSLFEWQPRKGEGIDPQ